MSSYIFLHTECEYNFARRIAGNSGCNQVRTPISANQEQERGHLDREKAAHLELGEGAGFRVLVLVARSFGVVQAAAERLVGVRVEGMAETS
jgi:hypothetical protein